MTRPEEEFVTVIAQLLVPRAGLQTTAHNVKNILTICVPGSLEIQVQASDGDNEYQA
jgi:hypothetical protein